MSVAGYLHGRCLDGRRVVVTEEPVVAGEGSAVERIYRDGVAAVWERDGGGVGEFYGSVEEYDPVLAWHCWLR